VTSRPIRDHSPQREDHAMTDPIEDHLAWCETAGFSPRTITDRSELLRRVHRDLPAGLFHANRRELTTWLGRRKWSTATKETYYGHLNGFFKWAEEDGDADLNPMEGIRCPRAARGVPRPLNDHELSIVLTRSVQPFKLAARIAYGSGLRCIEIVDLRREDITEEETYIRRRKGGKRAVIGTAPDVWRAVRDFPRGSRLIEHVGGRACERWLSGHAAYHWQQQLGLPKVTMHRLRHSFARRMRDAGHDPWVIKDALGHETIVTTEIYLGATEAESRLAVQGLRPHYVEPTC
jgi:integrase